MQILATSSSRSASVSPRMQASPSGAVSLKRKCSDNASEDYKNLDQYLGSEGFKSKLEVLPEHIQSKIHDHIKEEQSASTVRDEVNHTLSLIEDMNDIWANNDAFKELTKKNVEGRYKSLDDFLESEDFTTYLKSFSEEDRGKITDFIEQDRISDAEEDIGVIETLLDAGQKRARTGKGEASIEDDLSYVDKVLEETVDASYHRKSTKAAIAHMTYKLVSKGLMKADEVGDTPEKLSVMKDKYLKFFLSYHPGLSRGAIISNPSTSSFAMMLKYQEQDDPLSQMMARQLSLLTDMTFYQFRNRRNANSPVEQRLKKQLKDLIDKDGMAFVSLLTTPDTDLTQIRRAHAMYSVVKRNNEGGLDYYSQDTFNVKECIGEELIQTGPKMYERQDKIIRTGSQTLKAELRGDNDDERLENVIPILRGFAKDGRDTGIKIKAIHERFKFGHFQDTDKHQKFDALFKNLVVDEKKLNWYQEQPNCHIAGLYNVLNLAARINMETPKEDGTLTVPGLTPDVMAKDLKKLDFARHPNRAAFYVFHKLKQNAECKKAERETKRSFLRALHDYTQEKKAERAAASESA